MKYGRINAIGGIEYEDGTVQTSAITIPRKVVALLSAGQSRYIISHNLDTIDVFVTVRENNPPYEDTEVLIEYLDTNSVALDFGQVLSESYRVCVWG